MSLPFPLRASSSVWFEGEQSRCDGDKEEQHSTDIQRHGRLGVSLGRHDSRDDTHDAVEGHGEAVSGGAVRAGKNLWRVRIQGGVVDVEGEGNDTGEGKILLTGSYSSVAKEEGHGNDGTNGHGVFSAQQLGIAHETGKDGPKDTAGVGDGHVTPRLIRTALGDIGTLVLQILTIITKVRERNDSGIDIFEQNSRQENQIEGIRETNHEPGPPDHKSRDGDLGGGKETTEVNGHLGERKLALSMRRTNLSAGLEPLEGKRAWSVVFVG